MTIRIIIMLVTLASCTVAQSVPINISIENDNSIQPVTRVIFPEKPDIHIPYKNHIYAQLSTLGQLCKQSDLIIVGSITNVSFVMLTNNAIEIRGVSVDVNVKDTLFGALPTNSVQLFYYPNMAYENIEYNLPALKNVIIFASKKGFSPVEDNVLSWKFNINNAKGYELGRLEIFGQERGIIEIIPRSNITLVVRNYLKQLRHQYPVDKVAYAKLLKTLQLSDDLRIQQDAQADIILLLRFSNILDRNEIISHSNLGEDISKYAVWLNKCDVIRINEAAKVRTPTDDHLVKIIGLLKSNAVENKHKGLSQLGSFRKWIGTSPKTISPILTLLLKDKDQSIRSSAAALMTETKDFRALPILIDALNSDSLAQREVSKYYIERLLGEKINYDPSSSPEERKKSIQKIKGSK